MPFTIRRLTAQEIRNDCVQLQRMRARGIPIAIPPEWLDRETPEVEIEDGPSSLLFESFSGVPIYAIGIRLLAHSAVTFVDCQIVSDFNDSVELASFIEGGQFCIHGGRRFPAKEVLNSRLANGLHLGRGVPIEGTVLANGLPPLPAHYANGCRVGCSLKFVDAFSREFTHRTSLLVDRGPGKIVRAQRGAGLYGETPFAPPQDINKIMQLRYREILQAPQPPTSSAERDPGPPTEAERNNLVMTLLGLHDNAPK